LGQSGLRVLLRARRWLLLRVVLVTPLAERLALEFLEWRRSFDSLLCG
jgi:hypothetical protein